MSTVKEFYMAVKQKTNKHWLSQESVCDGGAFVNFAPYIYDDFEYRH